MNERAKDVENVMDDGKNGIEHGGQLLSMPWIMLNSQIQNVERSLNQKLEDLKADVNRRFDQVDKRFEQVDKRIDGLLEELKRSEDRTDKRFDMMQIQLERIESKIEKKTDRNLNNWYYLVMPIVAVIIGAIIGKMNF